MVGSLCLSRRFTQESRTGPEGWRHSPGWSAPAAARCASEPPSDAPLGSSISLENSRSYSRHDGDELSRCSCPRVCSPAGFGSQALYAMRATVSTQVCSWRSLSPVSLSACHNPGAPPRAKRAPALAVWIAGCQAELDAGPSPKASVFERAVHARPSLAGAHPGVPLSALCEFTARQGPWRRGVHSRGPVPPPQAVAPLRRLASPSRGLPVRLSGSAWLTVSRVVVALAHAPTWCIGAFSAPCTRRRVRGSATRATTPHRVIHALAAVHAPGERLPRCCDCELAHAVHPPHIAALRCIVGPPSATSRDVAGVRGRLRGERGTVWQRGCGEGCGHL